MAIRTMTIWKALALKLGREPTNAEANAEVLRILRAAAIERTEAGLKRKRD